MLLDLRAALFLTTVDETLTAFCDEKSGGVVTLSADLAEGKAVICGNEVDVSAREPILGRLDTRRRLNKVLALPSRFEGAISPRGTWRSIGDEEDPTKRDSTSLVPGVARFSTECVGEVVRTAANSLSGSFSLLYLRSRDEDAEVLAEFRRLGDEPMRLTRARHARGEHGGFDDDEPEGGVLSAAGKNNVFLRDATLGVCISV